MTRTDRFYIGQLNGPGLQTNVRPYAIADNAFAQLKNSYVFRGRVRKRFGARLMEPTSVPTPGYESLPSRLRVRIDTTDGAGAASGTVPGSSFVAGQMFSIGDQIYTCNVTGTPATLLNTGSGTATYNTTTGAYAFTGAATTTAVYFYPAQPVMGFTNYEQEAINQEPLYAFDQQFAYEFTSSGWDRLGSAVWTGNNSDFFWSTTWQGITPYERYLFVTNYIAADQIKYWNGSSWTAMNPIINSAGDTLETSRIVIPFKDRLICLNTIEKITGANQTFVNRCRFSQNGTPIIASDATAWRQDIVGKGGYIDAPTNEAIITAQFLYDRLIVYFERSTWELVYTSNQVLPFVWQQINTELGAESTFSQVPFDKVVLAIGDVGIHACSGTSVERIDQNIPQLVFDFHNADNGTERIVGIRDYFVEMVYWTIPDNTRDATYPFNNQVLTYNYKTGSWGINDDSITAFGYFQAATSASDTWQQRDITWAEATDTWRGAPLQAYFRNVVAGNQEGYVFIVDADKPSNCEALQITDVTLTSATVATVSCINHNLVEGFGGEGDYVYIQNMQGITELNGLILPINSVTDANIFTLDISNLGVSGTYTGGGTLTKISNINIYTKQYNFYVNQGRNCSVNKVDFFVDKTSSGEFTVDYFASSSELSLVSGGLITGALLGTSVVETAPYPTVTLESSQNRLWHSLYPLLNGESVQLRLYMSEAQLTDYDISTSDFALHAMIFNASPTGYRLQ